MTRGLGDPGEQQDWVDQALGRLGAVRTGSIDREHERPWSTAARVPSTLGPLWFKAHTPVLAREAPVTRLLASLHAGPVLDVVASDDDRCWLLTRDAGEKLRERVPTVDELGLVEPALVAYAALQRASVPYADELVAAGALDRRSPTLAGQLAAAIEGDVPGPEPQPASALTEGERKRLPALVPWVEELAAAASAVLPDSVDHSDLHDGNVFVDEHGITLADFGDACVGHPLVSFVVFERSLDYRLGVAPDGPEMARLRSAYLEPWTDLAPARDLEALAVAVRPLGLVGRALTWRALSLGVDDPGMREYDDGWPEYLRELLVAHRGSTSRVRPGAAPR